MMEPETKKTVRCAIYTRKSTEEGLQQEFNSLDAQRESCEAYIKSQAHEGWVCLPDKYDDGGYSGGTLQRPAMKQLLTDIEAGKIDCVVVYKMDRFSRRLTDFLKMMEFFQLWFVSFVSITQLISTATSSGRLFINVLMSFAEYERDLIRERTRDKMAAARRRGKYVGGAPILGYDLHPGKKLVVNTMEAAIVVRIFLLYLKLRSLLATVRELVRLGITTKRWTTKAGKTLGGHAFDRNRLHQLLTNVTYVGKIAYEKKLYAGEHEAIVDQNIFDRVQAMLARNYRTGCEQIKDRFGALLRGMVHCVACQRTMVHTYTAKGTKRYRYYTCSGAQKNGHATCPSKSIPANEIEKYVFDQIRAIGRDPSVVAETLAEAQSQTDERLLALERERRHVTRDYSKANAEVVRLAGTPHDANGATTDKLADAQDRIRAAEKRLTEIQEEMIEAKSQVVDERDLRETLGKFDPIWDALSPNERAKVIQLLIERIDYDGQEGTLEITFRASGLRALKEKVEEAA